MAPSRRQIAGRSPLVNQQRQITAFFGKSSSPTPSPSLSNKKTPKSNPNPNHPSPSPPPKSNSTNPPARSPSPGPATPSPVQSKLKKPLLVIGQTPSAEITYGDEVVGKRVKVYWPMDKRWYDGNVTSYGKSEGKHVVEYDDGEEESLDLGKEKIEWVIGAKSGVTFKLLRQGRRVVTDDDDDEDVEMSNVEEDKEDKSDCDDSDDEDWGKNIGKEVCESEEDDVELDDENEEIVEEKDEETLKGKRVSKTESRKRKTSEVAKSGSEKKSRTDKDSTLKGLKASAKKIEQGR